jgi:hypothetical protein
VRITRPAPFAAKGWQFDSDLVHHALLGNRVVSA